ncbi:MAG: sigma-70 family RNA polymerase sigma factor [Planctomycetaceae bacterium]
MGDEFEEQDHLSRIVTELSLVRAGQRLGEHPETELLRKREQFFRRYRWAIHRYLGSLRRSDTLADEAFQQFAVLYLEGRLAGYDPTRVPFHVYLKTILRNEAVRLLRRDQRSLELGSEAEGVADDYLSAAHQFDEALREQLVSQAMRVLHQQERRGEHYDHSIVQLLSELPRTTGRKASATDVADLLHRLTGERPEPEAARRRRSRAKRRLGNQLYQTAGDFLDSQTPERIEQLLRDVDLWQYVRPIKREDTPENE